MDAEKTVFYITLTSAAKFIGAGLATSVWLVQVQVLVLYSLFIARFLKESFYFWWIISLCSFRFRPNRSYGLIAIVMAFLILYA